VSGVPWKIIAVLYRTIGFIDRTISLNYKPYSAIADLHTFQFTAAHALRFSVSTSRILATDLNTGTITSNHFEVFLSFLLRSPWNADPVLHSNSPVSVVLDSVLHGTNLYATALISHLSLRLKASHLRLSYTEAARNTQKIQLPLLRVGTCLPIHCLALDNLLLSRA
jgi:hypothetical protein